MKKSLSVSFCLLAIFCYPVFAQNNELVSALKNHVTILASDSLGGRAFGYPEKSLAIDYITKQYSLAGFAPLNESYIQKFEHISGLSLIEGENIVGLIEGADPLLKNEYIVIGAHYDHMGWKKIKGIKTVFNGADDNASGVSSIIEIGKKLMAEKAFLKRSIIIVAFDGEEAGLIGSDSFMQTKVIEPEKIKAMYSLDMVGMFSKNGGVDLNGFNSLKNGEKLALDIAGRETVKVHKTANNIEMRTDTWSFGKNEIPSFYITTGLLSPYHKPEDDSNLLDYEGMGKVVELITSLVTEMAIMQTIDPNLRFLTRNTDPKFMIGWSISTGSNYQFFQNKFFDAKSVFAAETGITAQMKIFDYLSLKPSLTYELTGSNAEGGKFQMHSVSPQFDILITTPQKYLDRPFSFITAGAYIRHNFSATRDGSSFDFSNLYAANETGMKIGFGFQYMRYQMNYYYKYGLTRININDTDGNIYNRGSYFSFIRFF